MIRYTIVRRGEDRVAAVFVRRRDLTGLHRSQLIQIAQERLSLPVMLVAPDYTLFIGARAYAEFDAEPFLQVLTASQDVEMSELDLGFCSKVA